MGDVKTAYGAVVKDRKIVWPDRCLKCKKRLIETKDDRICIPCGQSWSRPKAETKSEV